MKTPDDLPTPDPAPEPEAKRSIQTGLPSADIVRRNLEQCGESYTEYQVNLLLWLITHARQAGVKSFSELGSLISYDASTMSRIVSGKYGANITTICARIDNFRNVTTERATIGEIPFIKTRLSDELWSLCDFTRIAQTMAIVNGPNQSGKTTSFLEYKRLNNHSKTHFVRVPVPGTCGPFIEALCDECGITTHPGSKLSPLKRLHGYFRSDQLIIIDEAHQLFEHGVKIRTLETIRELHDLTGVGIVLCGTDVLADFLSNPKWKGFLGQIKNRSTVSRRIAPEPYPEDVLAFCEAYGFGAPAPGSHEERIVATIAKSSGLGKLSDIFRMSQRYAHKRSEPLTWKAFLTTVATLQKWEKGES